jgi:hypothetical protein
MPTWPWPLVIEAPIALALVGECLTERILSSTPSSYRTVTALHKAEDGIVGQGVLAFHHAWRCATGFCKRGRDTVLHGMEQGGTQNDNRL